MSLPFLGLLLSGRRREPVWGHPAWPASRAPRNIPACPPWATSLWAASCPEPARIDTAPEPHTCWADWTPEGCQNTGAVGRSDWGGLEERAGTAEWSLEFAGSPISNNMRIPINIELGHSSRSYKSVSRFVKWKNAPHNSQWCCGFSNASYPGKKENPNTA